MTIDTYNDWNEKHSHCCRIIAFLLLLNQEIRKFDFERPKKH